MNIFLIHFFLQIHFYFLIFIPLNTIKSYLVAQLMKKKAHKITLMSLFDIQPTYIYYACWLYPSDISSIELAALAPSQPFSTSRIIASLTGSWPSIFLCSYPCLDIGILIGIVLNLAIEFCNNLHCMILGFAFVGWFSIGSHMCSL